MKKRPRDKGDQPNKLDRCRHCGEIHLRNADAARCARDARTSPGREPVETKKTPPSRFNSAVVGGNKRHHAIIRLARGGCAPRRIAKTLDLSLAEVNDVIARASRT